MATQDLNQLYQTATDAFSQATRFDKGRSRTAPFGYGDISGATPEQMSAFSTAPYGYGNINEYWNKPSGIATLPAATNIVPTADPSMAPNFGDVDYWTKRKQDEWRAQNPDPAVMPNFRMTGKTDLAASEAAGYDVPLWEEYTSQAPPLLPDEYGTSKGPSTSVIPDEYGGFFQSQFYDPGAMSMAVLTPVTLPSGETITFSNSESARQFQLYLKDLAEKKMGGYAIPEGGIQAVAGGGIVGLDYLTRRL